MKKKEKKINGWRCDLCGCFYTEKEWEKFDDSICPNCNEKMLNKFFSKVARDLIEI
jgi:rubrerythrin